MASLSFGKKKRPSGKEFRDGTVGEALDDIYADVEAAVLALETLDGLPKVETVSGAINQDVGTVTDFAVGGTGFLGGSTLATGTTSDGVPTAATEITFTAKKPGSGGNGITIKFVTAATPNTVTDSGGNTVTINLNSNGMGAGTALVDLVNHPTNGSALVCCAVGPTGNGSGTWVAKPADLSMTGGEGTDRTVSMQIGSATPTTNFNTISDTSLVLEAVGAGHDGTGISQSDLVLVAVKVDDTLSNQGIMATVAGDA